LEIYLSSFHLGLKVLAFDQVRDVILIFVLPLLLTLGTTLLLLQALVALSQLAQRRQAVRAQLVQDSGVQLSQLLVLTVTVDGEGVGGDGGVDCFIIRSAFAHFFPNRLLGRMSSR